MFKRIIVPTILLVCIFLAVSKLFDFHWLKVGDLICLDVKEAVNLGLICVIIGVSLGMLIMHYLRR